MFEKKLSGETNTDLSDLRGCFARWEVLSSRQQSLYALYKSRDFVPGYSRCALYWLSARSPDLWYPSEQELQLFHINSHISDSFLLKNKMSKCNSTLPPRGSYRFDNQEFIDGGIMGGIRVELREVPP